MIKKIYHGSKDIVKKPEYGKGKTYNDYGLGFYCTDTIEMAKEWGVTDGKDGYANCYELECDDLKILDLNGPDFCILHWLAVLLENREFDVPSGLALEAKEYILSNFAVDYQNYDAIIGYRAACCLKIDSMAIPPFLHCIMNPWDRKDFSCLIGALAVK